MTTNTTTPTDKKTETQFNVGLVRRHSTVTQFSQKVRVIGTYLNTCLVVGRYTFLPIRKYEKR